MITTEIAKQSFFKKPGGLCEFKKREALPKVWVWSRDQNTHTEVERSSTKQIVMLMTNSASQSKKREQEKESEARRKSINKASSKRIAEASSDNNFWAQRKNFENAQHTRNEKRKSIEVSFITHTECVQSLHVKLWTKLRQELGQLKGEWVWNSTWRSLQNFRVDEVGTETV